jgi:hypothetical protein
LARNRILLGGTLAAVLLAFAPAAVAAGPGGAFSPGLPQQSVSVQTTTSPPAITTTTSAGGSGLSGSGALAIAIGAVVVLGGISFFIWRDARRCR